MRRVARDLRTLYAHDHCAGTRARWPIMSQDGGIRPVAARKFIAQVVFARRAGSSVPGCGCGFDIVEESLKYQVMKRPHPLTPDRLVLPGRAALERVANNCRVFSRLQLEPVLAVQLIRPGHPERARGTRAVELFPEHRPGVVQAASLPPGSRSDLRRPDTVEVSDKVGDPLRRRRDNPFVEVLDLHRSSPHRSCTAATKETQRFGPFRPRKRSCRAACCDVRPAGLVPEHDDLLVGRRDDPRVHAPFVPGWLQGSQIWSKPVLSPACRAVAPWTDPP